MHLLAFCGYTDAGFWYILYNICYLGVCVLVDFVGLCSNGMQAVVNC